MPRGSTPKEERQYEHIKESYEKRGQKGRAKEIAARTVNKERAERGETKTSSSKSGGRSSKSSSSSGRASASHKKSSSSSSSKPKASSGSSRSSSHSGSSRKSSSSSSKPSAHSGSRSGGERTRAQLYQEAKKRDISGRSSMNKAQLERALSR